METIDTRTALATFFELLKSNEDISYVLFYSSKKRGAVPLIECACSSDMKEFAENEEVFAGFRNALAKTIEVKEPKNLQDELPHDLHYKQTVGQELGPVNEIPDKIQLSQSSSQTKGCSDGDLPDKTHGISASKTLDLPPPRYPFEATTTNPNMNTDMKKAQSTPATGTNSKTCTEVPDTIPFGGTFQREDSTDKVPTAATNSSDTNDSTSDISMCLSSTEQFNDKEAAVNDILQVSRSTEGLPKTYTGIGSATYPDSAAASSIDIQSKIDVLTSEREEARLRVADLEHQVKDLQQQLEVGRKLAPPDGCITKEMPHESRAKSAESFHEWSNEKKLRFIEDVNGWKDKSASKYRIFVQDLEKGGAKIVKNNWTRRISEKILKDIQRPNVWYDGSRVKDLLRFIRNVYIHYNQLHEDVKTSLGKPRDKVMDYFTARFPMLLDHTYRVIEQFSEEYDFRPYY